MQKKSKTNSFQTSYAKTLENKMWNHYDDVIMGATASQITSLTIVYSTVYSDADQSKHQSPASLAFVYGEFTVDRWIPRTKVQLRGKCFHLMTSLCKVIIYSVDKLEQQKHMHVLGVCALGSAIETTSQVVLCEVWMKHFSTHVNIRRFSLLNVLYICPFSIIFLNSGQIISISFKRSIRRF